MFDSTDLTVEYPVRRAEGVVNAVVRWPSDEEWLKRGQHWHILSLRRSGGGTEQRVEATHANAVLYDLVRAEDSPDLEPEEAENVIDEIARCEIVDVQLDPQEAVVEMNIVNFIPVKHHLRLPTTAQAVKFKRSQFKVNDLPYGRQQFRPNLQIAADLFDKCFTKSAGYKNGTIPIIHKDAAIRAAIEACEKAAGAQAKPDF